ncbi:class I SAM-dependent methyltransferase [Plantactinospora sp. KBS50]|uniref:class I SAM-dependent methyltransferase n=1 Tax=Plantactinospora sp. KBS50 TaxID=2024580 RepID=UPI0012FE6DB3|nr:methyltransferase domain-containing protein [Plantactinospora sp. KBS50]
MTADLYAEYAFNNDVVEAKNQLQYLSDTVDPHTFATLDSIGVAPGWECWDVGAGAGTVSHWLAERVGVEGRVLATDIKPQHIPAREGLNIARHDVRTDPFPTETFDLIHARLLLMHLPTREQVVSQLVQALKPGGVLVISDWETNYLDLILDSPDETGSRVFMRFLEICRAGSPLVGIDLRWAARAHSVMRSAGLSDVTTTTHASSWAGGTGACVLHRSNTFQLESRLLEDDFTEEELRTLRGVLLDPRFVISSYLMFTTLGRRAQ